MLDPVTFGYYLTHPGADPQATNTHRVTTRPVAEDRDFYYVSLTGQRNLVLVPKTYNKNHPPGTPTCYAANCNNRTNNKRGFGWCRTCHEMFSKPHQPERWNSEDLASEATFVNPSEAQERLGTAPRNVAIALRKHPTPQRLELARKYERAQREMDRSNTRQ